MSSTQQTPVASSGFAYRNGRLRCGSIDIDQLARQVGTPCFIYDARGIEDRCRALQSALSPLSAQIRYAIKANGNIALLRRIASTGCGMDAVSIGEVERAFLAGVPMNRICFAGVAKGDAELRAALDGRYSPIAQSAQSMIGQSTADRGPIGLFNVESMSELQRLAAVAAELKQVAQVAIRVNPGVVAGANDKVRVGSKASKFGLSPEDAFEAALATRPMRSIHCRGLHMHIGSQIYDMERMTEALSVLLALFDRLTAAGLHLDTLDVGAGVAVSSMGEPAPTFQNYADALIAKLLPRVQKGLIVLTEPGREIVAQSGVLLTQVRHVKQVAGRPVVITDAGLNALIRPALYNADHLVWPTVCDPLHAPDPIAAPLHKQDLTETDIVGPVCESSDVIGRQRPLPRVERGDVLAIYTAGAYAMSMAMTYNDHPLPAEVLIDEHRASIIRSHQTYTDLYTPSCMDPIPLVFGTITPAGNPQ